MDRGKRAVLWTVICPAKPNGNRAIITRTLRSLTIHDYTRTRLARDNTLWAVAKDLRWAFNYYRREMDDWRWWERLKQLRAAQRGENIIYIDFRNSNQEAA
jgi:hypothetical protein